ncbi:hypothetical protein LMG7053_02261 [Achromobacter ruhlandii]|uniref:Uncharacterized protein n=1 Tax=Achromobacter ruhlandii TaxID=72557 RepID=A0ABM8LVX2_9BURK|nr:hypothetical protein LMG7053_02261 [Achromobacter ruhlandii]
MPHGGGPPWRAESADASRLAGNGPADDQDNFRRHGDGHAENLAGAVRRARPPGRRHHRLAGGRTPGGAAVLRDFGLPDFLCADGHRPLPRRARPLLRQSRAAPVPGLPGGGGADPAGLCGQRRRRILARLRGPAPGRHLVPGAVESGDTGAGLADVLWHRARRAGLHRQLCAQRRAAVPRPAGAAGLDPGSGTELLPDRAVRAAFAPAPAGLAGRVAGAARGAGGQRHRRERSVDLPILPDRTGAVPGRLTVAPGAVAALAGVDGARAAPARSGHGTAAAVCAGAFFHRPAAYGARRPGGAAVCRAVAAGLPVPVAPPPGQGDRGTELPDLHLSRVGHPVLRLAA